MNRREALSSVGIILGGTIVGSQAFLTGCVQEKDSGGVPFDEQQISFLNELSEAILPKTEKSPGAKEVNVGAFMNSIVRDFYTAQEQDEFLRGFREIEKLSKNQSGKDFIGLSQNQKEDLLDSLEKEAGERLQSDQSEMPHFYIMMKQLAIWGYLSSEAVAFSGFNHILLTNYEQYDGCIDYNENVKPIFSDARQGMAYNYATGHMSRKN